MKIKRILAMLLSIVMVSTSFAFAETGMNESSMNYKGFLAGNTQQMKIYYNDSYWTGNSSEYNEHLASLSMALALTGYDKKATNSMNALKKIGCKKVKCKEYKPNTENCVATVMGSKKLSNGTILVPVVIRSTQNNKIWIKNVQAGSKGEAAGFKTAASKAYSNVTSYVKSLKTKKVKVWIMGHSRYGAIANLAAKKLNSKYGKKKVYAYCFENPMTAVKSSGNEKISNIHNVRAMESGVTAMLPSYMNFDVYGNWDKSFAISSGNEAKMLEMLTRINVSADSYISPSEFRWTSIMGLDINRFNKVISGIKEGEKITLDDFCDKYIDASQEEFWNLVLDRLQVVAKSRKAYSVTKSSKSIAAAKKFGYSKSDVYTIEKSVQTAIGFINGMSDSSKKKLQKEIGGQIDTSLTAVLASPLGKILADIIMNNKVDAKKYIGETDSEYATYVKTLWDSTHLEKSKVLTKSQKKQIKLFFSTMIDPILKVLEKDYDGNKSEQVLITLIYNWKTVMQAHYPEVTMAWLMTEDSNYTGE